MSIKVFCGITGVALAISLSSVSWAGGPQGGGMMVRPAGGGHGLHGGGPVGHPPGARPQGGVPHRFAGGAPARYRFGDRHIRTGLGRLRPEARFALRRARGFGYAYGPGGYDGGVYEPGTYAGSASPAYVGETGDTGPYGSTETGYYGAGYAGQGYAEPPLNAIGDASGPKVLMVHGGSRQTCPCRNTGPIVYRFGVGSYY